MTNGVFDLLHVDHVRLLHFAKQLGDYLIVAINSDESVKRIKGEFRPYISEHERREMLIATKWVDEVVIFAENTPIRVIEWFQPDVLVKGPECINTEIPGADYVESYGGLVICRRGKPQQSTTKIAGVIEDAYNRRRLHDRHLRTNGNSKAISRRRVSDY